jgi:aromatic ring-opening dioxygenase LigB subunit
MIKFACFSPHPPIILPNVGSLKDRERVKKTIENLEFLGRKLEQAKPDKILISSPHPDWGFEVPLYFLSSKLKAQSAKQKLKIQNYQKPNNVIIENNTSNSIIVYPVLTSYDSPRQHYKWGKNLYLKIKNLKFKVALIASGDMSHCLKEDGPYGLHSDGLKFDQDFIQALKEKNIEKILKLDTLYPKAGECGLRSFCFLLGILEEAGIDWQPEILSYEAPFGVGYLVADFLI